jgi:ABC-2 type transport system ATP-binding protein
MSNIGAIATDRLEKVYGKVRALDGLTLSVEPGTIFGFLGPNGAGKTTTIRLLTGLAHPTAGQAWVAGESISDIRKVTRRIGYLPEEPAIYAWMTPDEFLDHVGRLFGLDANERKARTEELLGLTGLSQVHKRLIGGFSRGMRQRLGLAQALVNRPEVLFLDEPVSALDPAGRKETLEMIGSLRRQCTVFMSTHILDDVERVCDTVGIINHGRLVVQAPQAELLQRYTIPAFELVCDQGGEGSFELWLEQLKNLSWIRSIVQENTTARIMVNDVDTARHLLLPMAVNDGIMLRRYEMVHPSLEDIFLRLVGDDLAGGRQA